MSVGKFISIALGLLLMAGLGIVGCEGDPGPQGPQGLVGPEGNPGQNRIVIPPDDRSFALMVANGTDTDLAGAQLVSIDFDSLVASGSDVAAVELAQPPTIDGFDGASDEWGDAPLAIVNLSTIQGSDNGIGTANLRIGYDDQYIFMLVSWSETAVGDFAPGADTTRDLWTFDDTDTSWTQSGGEDQLYVIWDINGATNWSTEGLGSIFNDGAFATAVAGEAADVWLWQSTRTAYQHLAADMVVRSEEEGGLLLDQGLGFVVANVNGELPKYMRANSTLLGSDYPLRDYEIASFNASFRWEGGATIPGYVYFIPDLSAANVQAVASFLAGTWTVEFRRSRNTGNADDTRF